MSNDNFVVDSLQRSALKTTREKMLKSDFAKMLFGFREGHTAQLVKWSEGCRGVPNTILRSALFGAIGRGERDIHLATPIASLKGVSFMHGGPQLDQADLDVWEQCLHLSRNSTLGQSFEVSAHPFLKAIGRDTGKSQREWLKESLKRLLQSTIEVHDGSLFYAGHLIHEYFRDEEKGLYYITINPNIVNLYGDGGWTLLELKDRLALKGHPLAQWLHGFYSTHATPFHYKVETIHRLCGSKSKNVTDFRKDIRKAFSFMNTAIGWKGEINDKGLITVIRPLTGAQKRHLRGKVPE
ncbi:replication protein C, IncQ-type [Pseudomonas canadensis]|uniref:replication protein C, IncQ-type n=1 Tax=Pseudomonas canadensis TaxID=915099 RepID=UPI0028935F08|nr:replication protein C, IncQ-type [Pseudomonas canadensis]WNJ84757.1 replication protein C, IncQ-type [Pseudomonas canadensis]